MNHVLCDQFRHFVIQNRGGGPFTAVKLGRGPPPLLVQRKVIQRMPIAITAGGGASSRLGKNQSAMVKIHTSVERGASEGLDHSYIPLVNSKDNL